MSIENKDLTLSRKEGESHEEYKRRRNENNRVLKSYLKGTIIHQSSKIGTLVKENKNVEAER